MPVHKPWMITRENNPQHEGFLPLREPVEGKSADEKKPKMFGVRLDASDAEMLRSMDVKPSDFIREAVHEALNKIRNSSNQAD